jgi:hypothetical protein
MLEVQELAFFSTEILLGRVMVQLPQATDSKAWQSIWFNLKY